MEGQIGRKEWKESTEVQKPEKTVGKERERHRRKEGKPDVAGPGRGGDGCKFGHLAVARRCQGSLQVYDNTCVHIYLFDIYWYVIYIYIYIYI
jgi:hypothetical protein